MKHLMNIVIWLYSRLLFFYPQVYRTAFGDELLAVFRLRLQDAAAHGVLAVVGVLIAELRDLPGILARAGVQPTAPTSTPAERWAVTSYFLFLAVASAWPVIEDWPMIMLIGQLTGWGLLGLALSSALLALFNRHPRPLLPILGGWIGLLAQLLNPSTTVFGIRLRWPLNYPDWIAQLSRPWIAFLLVLSVLVGMTLLVPWLHSLYRRIRNDWTLLSFTIYGFTPYGLGALLDETPIDQIGGLAGYIVLGLGAWGYLQAQSRRGRILVLLGAASLMYLPALLGSLLMSLLQAWDSRFPAWTLFRYAPIYLGMSFIALLLPALLRYLPRLDRATGAGTTADTQGAGVVG